MDVQLLNAFGEPVNKELEVYISSFCLLNNLSPVACLFLVVLIFMFQVGC